MGGKTIVMWPPPALSVNGLFTETDRDNGLGVGWWRIRWWPCFTLFLEQFLWKQRGKNSLHTTRN